MTNEQLPPWVWPRSAYVHVPFCAHHCGYCDFAVVAGRDDLIGRYLDALAAELALLGQPQPIETLFLGGGTPTHVDCAQLETLLTRLRHWLPLAPGHEFSVEANPDTLTDEKIAVLVEFGVNRVSLGAQSFHPHLLTALERQHNPDAIPRAVERVKRKVAQVSLDLIFAIPGQTFAEWGADLRRALALETDHLSTYGLTYEKGTRLWKQRQAGLVNASDEETELDFYKHGLETLAAAGFEHYEISNFARPGRRCRHNEVYWANWAYFGFGLGAARYVQGCRETNTRSLPTYLRKALAGESPVFQKETLGPEERAQETMAIQLRRCEGIERAGFQTQTGYSLDAVAGPGIRRHVELGFLEDDRDQVRLTQQGKFVADAVISGLM